MTTINIDRALLEQALDVLITRGAQPGYETERAWLKIVKSLEAALSAPAAALEQHRPFVPWSKEAEMVQASWQEAAGYYTLPHVVHRPKLSKDGNQWCALLGDNIQEGLCAFGDTPAKAMHAFDLAWERP